MDAASNFNPWTQRPYSRVNPVSLVWNSFVYRKHAELLSSTTAAQYSPRLPDLVLGLSKKLGHVFNDTSLNRSAPTSPCRLQRNDSILLCYLRPETLGPGCVHTSTVSAFIAPSLEFKSCPGTAAQDDPARQMMIAVSNTGVGFPFGSVGADVDALSLTRVLYIPYTPALHPHTAFVYPSGEHSDANFK